MRSRTRHQLLLLAFVGTAMLLCVSCRSKTIDDRAEAGAVLTDKCLIDVASPQPCTLSKSKDERAVWVNNSSTDVFVCVNPDDDPFEAYGWKVPHNDKRKAGSVKAGVTPDLTKTYTFYSSASFCTWPPSTAGIRTNPKIIIGT